MSSPEFDFFAFAEGEETPPPEAGMPQPPPPAVAKLVEQGVASELPLRREYSEEEDLGMIAASDLDFAAVIGEPYAKEHSDGTVRTYLAYKDGYPRVAVIADRDDMSPGWLLRPQDILCVHVGDLARLGNDDPARGVQVLRKLAAETTTPRFPDHDIYGHLDEMSQLVFGMPEFQLPKPPSNGIDPDPR